MVEVGQECITTFLTNLTNVVTVSASQWNKYVTRIKASQWGNRAVISA